MHKACTISQLQRITPSITGEWNLAIHVTSTLNLLFSQIVAKAMSPLVGVDTPVRPRYLDKNTKQKKEIDNTNDSSPRKKCEFET